MKGIEGKPGGNDIYGSFLFHFAYVSEEPAGYQEIQELSLGEQAWFKDP